MATEFFINYKSVNHYENIVSDAIFEFCVIPCNDISQTLIQVDISNSLGESWFSYKNVFGAEVQRIRSLKEFNIFDFVMKARVEKKNIELAPVFTSLEEELKALNSIEFYIDNYLFLKQTTYTDIGKENQEWVLKTQNEPSLYDFLLELNKYIYKGIEYNKDTTNVKTTAQEALKLKSGVCQDFVHLFLGVARENKIPARYVSGYLNQGKSFIGSSLMHAWVEALIPSMGWVGFDPTNNGIADIHYIKVSHGTDYTDCTPIKGIIKTTGENETTYQVKVIEQHQ